MLRYGKSANSRCAQRVGSFAQLWWNLCNLGGIQNSSKFKSVNNNTTWRERRVYQLDKITVMRNLSTKCSITIDGKDQSAFGLPHFTTVTKDIRGHQIKVRLIEISELCAVKLPLFLFTLTKEFENGTSHIHEALPRFTILWRECDVLPRRLFI